MRRLGIFERQDLDTEPSIHLLQRRVLLAHLGQVGQPAAVQEEGGLLLVDREHLHLERRRHRDLPQTPDPLGAPALTPDRLELVEEVDVLMVLGVLRHLAGDEAGEPRQLAARRPLLYRHLGLLGRAAEERNVTCRPARTGAQRSHARPLWRQLR